jgi:hypothetical protein
MYPKVGRFEGLLVSAEYEEVLEALGDAIIALAIDLTTSPTFQSPAHGCPARCAAPMCPAIINPATDGRWERHKASPPPILSSLGWLGSRSRQYGLKASGRGIQARSGVA